MFRSGRDPARVAQIAPGLLPHDESAPNAKEITTSVHDGFSCPCALSCMQAGRRCGNYPDAMTTTHCSVVGGRIPTRLLRLALLVFFPLLLASAIGAEETEGDYSRGMLDRAAALDAAKGVTTEKYPDAENVLIDAIERVRYAENGTYTQWAEEYVKILTEEGRRDFRTVSSHFTIPYQRGPEDCKIPLLEVIKPDGRTVAVDVKSQARIVVDSRSMAMNIYNPNEKIIQVNVPGLEPGDVLHVVMFDRFVHPRMKDSWCDLNALEGEMPILRSVIEIDAPTNRPLRSIALKSEVKGTVTRSASEKDGRMLYRWEARNVPRMFAEPNMPPIYMCVQRLLVSTEPDWQSVSRWYWDLSAPHLATTPAMKAKVEALLQGLGDRRRRIEALFAFVSQRIRYMGITVESESPGYEPHDVKDTFEAQHGVCRDKAALLVALLREAGFDAFPTLIHAGFKKDAEVPQPYFNHAIVAVREKDGTYTLMDPTQETTTELFPAHLNDKSFLVATPEGDPLRTSPISPAETNLMRVETRGRVNSERRLEAETILRFEGANDNAYRGWFARIKPEERRRFVETVAERAAPGARVTEVTFTPADMTDVSTTLTVRVAYEAEQMLIDNGRSRLLPLPTLGTRIGLVNFIIGQTGLKERKYPLQTETACGVQERISFDLGDSVGAVESMPRPEPYEDASILWRSECRQTNALLEAALDFRLKAVEFSPADYRNLKETLQKIERSGRQLPIYAAPRAAQAAADAADIQVLEETVAYDVTDTRSWTETRSVSKKILTYSGKKQASEIKIAYNTGWEDVRFERAVVTSADGKRREISPREINLMDAPWVGTAKRYPAGKILVASLPAVDTGCTVEYRYVRTCTNRPFFAVYESFRSFDPLVRKTVRITAPAGLVRSAAAGCEDVGVTCVTNVVGGRVQVEWTAGNVKAVKREDALPPWWSFNPTVFASAGDWKTYARGLDKSLRKAAGQGRQAAREARRLAAPATGEEAKLAAIRDFVALRVRATEPGVAEMPQDRISPADQTLLDGYGNTTDRAVLLYAMLDAAGFDPEFVLVSSIPAIPELAARVAAMPVAGAFGHVLVRVRDESGFTGRGNADRVKRWFCRNNTVEQLICLTDKAERWIYLNDTDQYAALGTTPHAGALGIFPPSGGVGEIVPARPDAAESRYWLTLAPNGDVSLRRRQVLYGMAFGVEHKRFAEMTPEELRRYHQELIALLSQGAETNSALAADFSRYPGAIEYAVRLPRYAVADAGFLYGTFPEFVDSVLEARGDTRSNPLMFGARREKVVTLEIALPPGYRVEYLPADVAARNVAGAGVDVTARTRVEERKDGRTAIVEARGVVAPAIVSPVRYRELLDLDEDMARKQSRTFLLKSDAPAK